MSTLVIIKTKYASIERLFDNRVEAAIFLKQSQSDFEVLSYEVRSLKG